ncbi:outer membrane beta-barrel protein [Flavihumibacter rivuli]|uniref:outer membrane beta-barrel protein n=1 Tax=Flavihumibacter rivuli TaxID=2838156 RepID=UPI001BDF2D26|nr:outer membrane beta-barrel protein [Flavihumibacter rivuli]ULQ55932.1 outer membrane beta-barrel protein [Flavihumibacter rivuli]
MKKLILTGMLAFSLSYVSAQSGERNHIGGYGAAVTEITAIDGNAALSVGGHGGVLLNHNWLVGISGYTTFFSKQMEQGKAKLRFNHFGLYGARHFQPSKPVNLSVGLMVGAGTVELNNQSELEKGNKRDGDWTYVIQPDINLNVRIFRYMKVQARAGYRFTGDTNGAIYTRSNLNGATAGIGLLFGSF